MSGLSPEQEARQHIDDLLDRAGWAVQGSDDINLYASQGVAVREFRLNTGFGQADYLLYVDRKAAGLIEAKPVGFTLTGVERQSEKYSQGLPSDGPILSEETVYHEGQMVNGNSLDYWVPAMKDLPEAFECIMVENQDGPGPFGSKGVGEAGLLAEAPAIGNAVYDAVGVRIRDLPITPEKVLRALGKI